MSSNVAKLVRDFTNKTVFISGASRGIGKAIALGFASRGANVVITGKTTEKHPKLPGTIHDTAVEVEKAGGRALPLSMDVRDVDQVNAAVEKAVKHFNTPIDVLVNNASAISLTDTLNTEAKKYDLMHQVNVRGTFFCSKACIPYLKEAANPHIINLSPPLDMNEVWFRNFVAYSMSKFGMSMCVLGMASELKPFNIAVNAIWPKTTIATEAIRLISGDTYDSYQFCRKPEILADCAVLIASQDSKTTTGNFFIDQDLLKSFNVADLDRYAMVEGTPEDKLALDFFVPGCIPPQLEAYTETFKQKKDTPTTKNEGVKLSTDENLLKIYSKMQKMKSENPELINAMKKTCQFNIVLEGGNEFWYYDPSQAEESFLTRSNATREAEVYVKALLPDFVTIMSGSMSPTTAYMSGKMKFKGSMADVKMLMGLWKHITKK